MNAAQLFDRNPLHVVHLQGPVDRLHDTNLKTIYERAGRILLIQRWRDLATGAPQAFLLFESELAANSCCNRIGAPRITTAGGSHHQSVTSAILQPNQPNHPALQQWLNSQSMAPSYVTRNPPTPPKAAEFPLGCLRVLSEDAIPIVAKLKEFKCGPGWWRFIAQMYVANKLWAAARVILKCEKEPLVEDEVIDISDDSAHEHASDDDQSDMSKTQKPSKSSKVSHNAWLPSKRNVSGARAKLGVVTSKPAASAKSKAATKKSSKSTPSAEAPPFVPTPMNESPPTDATPQTGVDTPPTVPATLPMSTRSSTAASGPSNTSQPNGAINSSPGAAPIKTSSPEPSPVDALAQPSAQPQSVLPSCLPLFPPPQPSNPTPEPSSCRKASLTPTPSIPVSEGPTPALSGSDEKRQNATKEPPTGPKETTAGSTRGTGTPAANLRAGVSRMATRRNLSNSVLAPDSPELLARATLQTDSKSTLPPGGPTSTMPTRPEAAAPPTGPKSMTTPVAPKRTTPPTGPKALLGLLPGQKAPPTGPRALMNAFGNRPSSPATQSAPSINITTNATNGTSTPNPSATVSSSKLGETTSTPGPSGTTLATITNTIPKTSVKATRHRALLGWLDAQGEMSKQVQVKKEIDQEALEGDKPLQDSPAVTLSRVSPAVPPAQDSSLQETSPNQATQNPPSAPVVEDTPTPPTQTLPPVQATQTLPPIDEPSSAVPIEEDSVSNVPMEGDSSFGVSPEDLFPNSIALTEDASSVMPLQGLPSLAPAQTPPMMTTREPTSTPPIQDTTPAPPTQDPPPSMSNTLSATPRASVSARPRTPIPSPFREPLSFFGISSSPGSLLPSSSSPTKRKSDTLESRLIKRRRHRTSSSKSEPIIVEPEISALEAENARAAETQAEEDWVSELLRVDMSDYPESVMARLSGSDKSNRGIVSASDKFKSSPTTQGSISVESDTDLELRSLRATRDENEALKMKIKVLEMTLPTAESVKNELYAERKEKTQLIEALEIERSLLTQSEALRKQSDATREGLQQRIKQLEDRLNESAVTLERAREAAQVASEQRRKAEEATLLADLARTKLGVSLDSERDLVSRVREELAEEREIRAEVQAKLAATEARLAAEQRRYTEARDQAEKERAEAKSFLEAEKAIVSAQEAKLEREKDIRSGLETKLKEMEEKLKDEQAKQVEDKKKADAILQKELTMAMKLVTAEREVTRGERAKTATELEAKELAEKEIILLKEQLTATEKKLKEAQDGNNSMKRDLVTFKDQLSESTEQQHILRAHLSTAGTKLAISEGRTRAIEDRVMDAEEISRRHALELSRLQNELVSERHVLIMERQTLAKERISRRELEAKLVVAEERLRTGTKQTGELQAQLQTVISSGQGSTEQLQTQRTLLHIARTRIQELEQAIQRVESDLDASRTAEAAAKTMVQLWGPPLTRTHLSSPVSDIVDRNSEQIETETDSFISLMKPPRQQSFKLKRTSTPARLLKLDMPSGEPTNIDLGGLPANPETIIDLLHRSKCAGVFWDIIMDEYGAMGCFDAAEAIAAGKLKSQL
ncbi:unnamed protein product [Rhizoctonia solani]|uniref:Uncharacterized protein n=1 Tax=Rhizoctonia solani TaxID=456999 RepID=A0A8H2XDW0_9AGAM|nr:unnamed protein product [Rhizoctonia solani]